LLGGGNAKCHLRLADRLGRPAGRVSGGGTRRNPAAPRNTKIASLIALLSHKDGATIDDLTKLYGPAAVCN